MVISLKDKWIWDSWYVHDGVCWHAFFLQADKSIGDPELRHWHTSIGHATGDDLVNWQHLGTCLKPSVGPAWDDMTTWTGSVIRGDDDLWHMFYTGSKKSENGLKQRIGHATSTDLHSWARVGDGLCLDLSGDIYEEYDPDKWHDRALRDPWVIKDPQGDGWLMYFTARLSGVAEPNAAGAIGLATSANLHDWALQPPVFAGGFGQLEVPQVFERAGRWYCLFCTSSKHWSKIYSAHAQSAPVTGTHFLIGDSPRGPWQIAPGEFLDGALPCERYAGRILNTGDDLVFLGFADQPGGAAFVGQITNPDPVEIDADGLLHVRPLLKAAE